MLNRFDRIKSREYRTELPSITITAHLTLTSPMSLFFFFNNWNCQYKSNRSKNITVIPSIGSISWSRRRRRHLAAFQYTQSTGSSYQDSVDIEHRLPSTHQILFNQSTESETDTLAPSVDGHPNDPAVTQSNWNAGTAQVEANQL